MHRDMPSAKANAGVVFFEKHLFVPLKRGIRLTEHFLKRLPGRFMPLFLQCL